MLAFESLLKAILDYSVITIYHHVNPDLDALGSQFGLKYWLLENFPEKKVYCLGENDAPFFDRFDVIDLDIIKESLAIIVDTPSAHRVSDQRFTFAKISFMLDHHPLESTYTTYSLQGVNYASTTELIATFIRQTSYSLSKKSASALYMGLLTDTMCFKTNNTTADTLSIASYLASFDLDISGLNHAIFDVSLDSFKFKGFVNQHLKVLSHFGYIILKKEDLVPFNISLADAKNYVSEFSEIKGINIWGIFILNDEALYDGSIRSKSVAINEIAKQYNGGGHKNACGVKSLSYERLSQLIEELIQLS